MKKIRRVVLYLTLIIMVVVSATAATASDEVQTPVEAGVFRILAADSSQTASNAPTKESAIKTGVESGWDTSRTHYYKKGTAVTGFCRIDGKYYYFRKNGRLYSKKGRLIVDGKNYYVQKDASLATGVKKINGYTYLFSGRGVRQTGRKKVGEEIWYLQDNGRLEARQKGSTYYRANGKKMSKTDAYDYETYQTARSIAARITNDRMTKAQKRKKCFDWVMAKYYIIKRKFKNKPGWIPLYANDHFHGRGGTCQSDAAAFAYLAKAIGYQDVYVCMDSDKGNGHAWAEIGGKVYDPLFSQAKSYWKYYGATYQSYRLYPRVRVRMS